MRQCDTAVGSVLIPRGCGARRTIGEVPALLIRLRESLRSGLEDDRVPLIASDDAVELS
jgi:hypothetical protein